MEQKNPIQVAGRLFRTLELLAETGSAGLMELSSSLELNKTTAHRVLNSLIYMGYARQNPALCALLSCSVPDCSAQSAEFSYLYGIRQTESCEWEI